MPRKNDLISPCLFRHRAFHLWNRHDTARDAMNKVFVTLITTAIFGLCTICVTVVTNWVTAVNLDRQTHHDAIKELQIRAEYVSGNIPAAPVTKIKR